jgi:hypothetical protein
LLFNKVIGRGLIPVRTPNSFGFGDVKGMATLCDMDVKELANFFITRAQEAGHAGLVRLSRKGLKSHNGAATYVPQSSHGLTINPTTGCKSIGSEFHRRLSTRLGHGPSMDFTPSHLRRN